MYTMFPAGEGDISWNTKGETIFNKIYGFSFLYNLGSIIKDKHKISGLRYI